MPSQARIVYRIQVYLIHMTPAYTGTHSRPCDNGVGRGVSLFVFFANRLEVRYRILLLQDLAELKILLNRSPSCGEGARSKSLGRHRPQATGSGTGFTVIHPLACAGTPG